MVLVVEKMTLFIVVFGSVPRLWVTMSCLVFPVTRGRTSRLSRAGPTCSSVLLWATMFLCLRLMVTPRVVVVACPFMCARSTQSPFRLTANLTLTTLWQRRLRTLKTCLSRLLVVLRFGARCKLLTGSAPWTFVMMLLFRVPMRQLLQNLCLLAVGPSAKVMLEVSALFPPLNVTVRMPMVAFRLLVTPPRSWQRWVCL